jgi:hypothetical protein
MFNTKQWLQDASASNKFRSSYIRNFLDICGNIILRNGGFSLPNGDVSMNGNIWVGGNTIINGNVSISGNLYVKSDASFNKSVYIKGNLICYDDIYQIDGKQNISISSWYENTFTNYGTGVGPNLIAIGNQNYRFAGNQFRDSICVGCASYVNTNPVGHSNINFGSFNFPSIINSIQTIAIGHDIGVNSYYSPANLANGNNNVFIGSSTCSSPEVNNTVNVGSGAGNWTSDNMTCLGSFSSQREGQYNGVSMIGIYTTSVIENAITFGSYQYDTLSKSTVDISGSLNVIGPNSISGGAIMEFLPINNHTLPSSFYSRPKIVGFSCTRTSTSIWLPINSRITIGGGGYNTSHFNTGEMAATGIFTAPVNGYYIFYYNITGNLSTAGSFASATFTIRKNATTSTDGIAIGISAFSAGAGSQWWGGMSAITIANLNQNETVSAWTGTAGNATTMGLTHGINATLRFSNQSNCYGFLLYAS